MRGGVIGFDPDANNGAIIGDDGQRYDFVAADWQGAAPPRRGDGVEFVANGGRAASVRLVAPAPIEPSLVSFYFSPRGRLARSPYWLRFLLPVALISIALNLLQLFDGSRFAVIATIFQLLVLWPGVALLIRRMHDRDKPGSLVWALYGPMIAALLFTLIASVMAGFGDDTRFWGTGIVAAVLGAATMIVAIWFFVEFGCLRGTVGANRYGPDPVRAR